MVKINLTYLCMGVPSSRDFYNHFSWLHFLFTTSTRASTYYLAELNGIYSYIQHSWPAITLNFHLYTLTDKNVPTTTAVIYADMHSFIYISYDIVLIIYLATLVRWVYIWQRCCVDQFEYHLYPQYVSRHELVKMSQLINILLPWLLSFLPHICLNGDYMKGKE